MKKYIIKLFCVLAISITLVSIKNRNEKLETLYPTPGASANPIADYEGCPEEDLSNVMVPIPKNQRVFNKSGIQCVWATLETCGNYASEKKLKNITEQQGYKSYETPYSTSKKLKDIKVKYKQTNNKADKSLILESIVQERRGCLFGVPGHAMTLVHYDEENKIVKYINNSDPELLIRTWSMSEFDKRWNGWICVIYADEDIIPEKYILIDLPVVDRNNPQGQYQKDYILKPKN